MNRLDFGPDDEDDDEFDEDEDDFDDDLLIHSCDCDDDCDCDSLEDGHFWSDGYDEDSSGEDDGLWVPIYLDHEDSRD
jgi:hypothetical protein